MMIKRGMGLLFCLVLVGCGKAEPAKPVLVSVNDYDVTVEEFENGFNRSAHASDDDRLKARREYLGTLINQKLILQDAEKRNLDKEKTFLKAIEGFWEQTIVSTAVNVKTQEINASIDVPEGLIHKTYDDMVKSGATTGTYEGMRYQIKSKLSEEMSAHAFGHWVDTLRLSANVKINESLLEAKQ